MRIRISKRILLNGFGCFIAILLLPLTKPVNAGLPDRETYKYVTNRYNVFLEATRGGCSHYANPEQITEKNATRYLPVLVVRGEGGGTLCNGIFEFLSLRVDCQKNLVDYNSYIGSPSNWNEAKPYKDTRLALKVCSLPAKPSSN